MPTKPQHAAIYRPIPAFLRGLREKAGLTQRDLAERIKRPQSWVQKSEVGSRRIDVAEFALICRGCGVDPSEALRQVASP